MSAVLIAESLELDLDEGCPSTVMSQDGVADIHRFFPDPVVVACSVENADGDSEELVERAAGLLLAEYRGLAGYARRPRPTPVIEGASAAVHVEFRWEADGGQLMRSTAIAASDGARVAVVHATAPEAHGEAAFASAEHIVLAARLV